MVLMEQAEGQLDAIGRGAADRGTEQLLVLFDGDGLDRIGQGNGMTGRASFHVRCAYVQITQMSNGSMEFCDAACVDSIVVAK